MSSRTAGALTTEGKAGKDPGNAAPQGGLPSCAAAGATSTSAAADPILVYTMSHFAPAIVCDADALHELLKLHQAPNPDVRLMVIQERECSLRASTFATIADNCLEMVVCRIVFSEGLDGSWDANAQAEALGNAGLGDDEIAAFPTLGPGEDIGCECEGRMQFGDLDAAEFCAKYGITDDEWEEIQDGVEGEGSTDNVYLELGGVP